MQVWVMVTIRYSAGQRARSWPFTRSRQVSQGLRWDFQDEYRPGDSVVGVGEQLWVPHREARGRPQSKRGATNLTEWQRLTDICVPLCGAPQDLVQWREHHPGKWEGCSLSAVASSQLYNAEQFFALYKKSLPFHITVGRRKKRLQEWNIQTHSDEC